MFRCCRFPYIKLSFVRTKAKALHKEALKKVFCPNVCSARWALDLRMMMYNGVVIGFSLVKLRKRVKIRKSVGHKKQIDAQWEDFYLFWLNALRN